MLRANGSEQSSIATEDALRYLRAAKYNSTRAIEIYKNYQVCGRERVGERESEREL